MSNLVTTGQMANMAEILSAKLGRRVQVHRVEYKIKTSGGRFRTLIRYTLAIEGAHPPIFPGLTVNEVKGRMAMLTDLLFSGVITSAAESTKNISREEARRIVSSSESTRGTRDEEPSAKGDGSGFGESSSVNDIY